MVGEVLGLFLSLDGEIAVSVEEAVSPVIREKVGFRTLFLANPFQAVRTRDDNDWLHIATPFFFGATGALG